MGSSSRLVKRDPSAVSSSSSGGTVLELCGDQNRMLWGRRFDGAMVAFLTVLREVIEFCRKIDPTFVPPYSIDKDKIGDLSIRTQFNDEHAWTRSLKFLLTDLKWLIAWISTRPRR